ncbi:hypothetical protein MHK_007930 [Candidatus Magnetomorum sp. HK-1]|nr:hypothetical protein MHK_007930 [Candidatus Magnetomorum sp. HK-1]
MNVSQESKDVLINLGWDCTQLDPNLSTTYEKKRFL